MSNILYFKINKGARTRAEIEALITSIDGLINELMTTALRAVIQGDVAEYDIETGQTVQRVKYTNQKTILDSIEGCERLRQIYVNKLICRKVRLVDSRNFIR